jgi:multiple sugar transport system permease protein
MSSAAASRAPGRLRRARLGRIPVSRTVVYALLLILSAVVAAPLLWMVSTSLKTGPASVAIPPSWIPDQVVWSNYPDALDAINFPVALRNTLIYAIPSVIGTLVSCSLAAYGFSRIKWPGRDLLFIVLLMTMMLNDQVTFIPLYVIYAKLGWVGTFLPLIVPTFLGSPFFIFLLRQFFLGIPTELSDAARIDGASEFRILLRIIVPLSWPVLITVGLFTFIDKWTDFFKPLIYLKDPDLQPLSVAIQVFQSAHRTDWPLAMAAAVIVTAPLVVIYFFAQRKFIEGITLTGIKG